MKIKDIILNIEYEKIHNEIDINIEEFNNNSRIKSVNSLYFGITGDKFNGSKFYKNALVNGAVCAIVENINLTSEEEEFLVDNNKCVIVVKNSMIALEQLAKYKRSIITSKVIAITGSAGKTSTKDLTYSALKNELSVFKTPGNKNNNIGLPLSLLNIKNEDIAVLEMGMNHLKEISYLTNIAKPNIAIITNVGTSHIGNLKSRENILKAKLEILEGLTENGLVIINNDNDLLNSWASSNKDNYNILKYAINEESDIKIDNIKLNAINSNFVFDNVFFEIPIPGEQYVSNSLPGILIAKKLGLKLESVSEGLKNIKLSKNRMDIINKEGITVINDSYNANLDAVKYSLKNLSNFKGRKIACLGDMLELGEHSLSLHQNLGNSICENSVDMLITVGKLSEMTHNEALKNKVDAKHFDNNNEAIDFLQSIKKSGDVILVKASNSCGFIQIVEALTK